MCPKASVIIPHYNDKDRLGLCLASLDQCGSRKDVEFIVVDNGPPTLDAAFRANHPTVRFHHEPRQGAAFARNTGTRHAKGHILIFTDSDCQVAPDFLSQAFELGAIHDISGGKVRLTTPTHDTPNAIQAFEQVFAFNQRRYIEEMGFSVTANLVTNIDIFKRVGPFRAGLSEDYDWCHRATACGYQLSYQPDLIVNHPCRASWEQLKSKWKRITAETYGIHKSNERSIIRWIFRALIMPLSILAHAPRILTIPTSSARAGALLTLARIRLWRMAEMIRLVLARSPAETR
ncbi:Glycosyltransferase, GT2 family [Litoreibacter ascidiaceicola]|uniref:Glycosyltransferase, GT2 family n=1 Tax=Litoreibacter ascidiaceicola TaxID=1486859 RepID=A0A1M5B954_9RHOB|nr:glycosyltransferase [Litoreibacter ascidiaceicola]SHF39044.1 Glycosyltransferase, GT2 family [Litoreibacter ascidiaceicola]